ncbi:MAG: hypothetical protein MJ252_30895 [archaeon]|nr:hypothetical protein [archaeon]
MKNFYNPESDVLLHFWTYVISKSNIQNIMAESTFLKLFNFIGYAYGEASYLAITFITAADSILRDFVKEDPYKTSLAQNIIPSIISTTKVDSYGKKYQDRTMSVSNKKSMKI